MERLLYEERFGTRPHIRTDLQAGRWTPPPFAEFWSPTVDQLHATMPHRLCSASLLRRLREGSSAENLSVGEGPLYAVADFMAKQFDECDGDVRNTLWYALANVSQTLLDDLAYRFELRIHTATTPISTYELLSARSGSESIIMDLAISCGMLIIRISDLPNDFRWVMGHAGAVAE
jgi:hypothetical protein